MALPGFLRRAVDPPPQATAPAAHTEDVLLEVLEAADRSPTDRPSFTLVPDWVMICERVTPTAFRLWCILRSMQFERDGPGIPPLTLDQVCWLLPGVNGKPTSRARARQALDLLLAEGLLEDVTEEGVARTAARSYRAHDTPRGGMGWPSARRKLDRYRKTWRRMIAAEPEPEKPVTRRRKKL